MYHTSLSLFFQGRARGVNIPPGGLEVRKKGKKRGRRKERKKGGG
jgi:hypothetical protein